MEIHFTGGSLTLYIHEDLRRVSGPIIGAAALLHRNCNFAEFTGDQREATTTTAAAAGLPIKASVTCRARSGFLCDSGPKVYRIFIAGQSRAVARVNVWCACGQCVCGISSAGLSIRRNAMEEWEGVGRVYESHLAGDKAPGWFVRVHFLWAGGYEVLDFSEGHAFNFIGPWYIKVGLGVMVVLVVGRRVIKRRVFRYC